MIGRAREENVPWHAIAETADHCAEISVRLAMYCSKWNDETTSAILPFGRGRPHHNASAVLRQLNRKLEFASVYSCTLWPVDVLPGC